MNLNLIVLSILAFSSFTTARASMETKRAAAANNLIEGCASSLTAPNLVEFMERAKAAGKPYPDEASAKKALDQIKNEKQKTEFFKKELYPAAKSTCECYLENNLAKIKASKTESEINEILKSLKPEPDANTQLCAEKFLLPVMNKKKK